MNLPELLLLFFLCWFWFEDGAVVVFFFYLFVLVKFRGVFLFVFLFTEFVWFILSTS